MIRDYRKYVSKMSYGELCRRIKKSGQEKFTGCDDEFQLFVAMVHEKDRRDAAEKEYLSREKVSRFEIMDI